MLVPCEVCHQNFTIGAKAVSILGECKIKGYAVCCRNCVYTAHSHIMRQFELKMDIVFYQTDIEGMARVCSQDVSKFRSWLIVMEAQVMKMKKANREENARALKCYKKALSLINRLEKKFARETGKSIGMLHMF